MRMFTYQRMAQYYETDGMTVIHHANYLHWMEEARIAWMDAIGYGFEKLLSLGIMSPLSGISIQYIKPVRFKDQVNVNVKLLTYDGVHIDFGYEMVVKDTVVCTAESKHVLTSSETGMVLRTRRVCPDLDAMLKQVLQEDAQ